MECTVCELPTSGATCVQCAIPLCEDCATACKRCSATVCSAHIHTTSHGRLLCGKCWDERTAARKKRREAALAAAAAPAPPVEESTEFVDDDADEREVVPSFATMEAEEGEGPKELKLPDEKRPILRSSGYEPPTLSAYVVAFVFFGISGIVLFASVPDLRKIAWPFEASGAEYQSNMAPQMKDTNSLRETSNISRLNVLYELPFFLITWAFFLAYLIGLLLIFFPSLRILVPRVREWYQTLKYGPS